MTSEEALKFAYSFLIYPGNDIALSDGVETRLSGVRPVGLAGQQNWAATLLGFEAPGALFQGLLHCCFTLPPVLLPTNSLSHCWAMGSLCDLNFALSNSAAPNDNLSNLPQPEIRVTH